MDTPRLTDIPNDNRTEAFATPQDRVLARIITTAKHLFGDNIKIEIDPALHSQQTETPPHTPPKAA
jgi:hypothetical protein